MIKREKEQSKNKNKVRTRCLEGKKIETVKPPREKNQESKNVREKTREQRVGRARRARGAFYMREGENREGKIPGKFPEFRGKFQGKSQRISEDITMTLKI